MSVCGNVRVGEGTSEWVGVAMIERVGVAMIE